MRQIGLFLLVLSVCLAGCGVPAQGVTPTVAPTATPPATATAEPLVNTPTPGVTPLIPTEQLPSATKPPAATLELAGQTQVAGVGTYCWSSPDGPGLCADMVGIPTSPQPLTASAPVKPRFVMPLDEVPTEMTLIVMAVTADDPDPSFSDSEFRWWEYRDGESHTLTPAREAEIELDLQPGLYVLSLFVRWEGRGDVIYGWYIKSN